MSGKAIAFAVEETWKERLRVTFSQETAGALPTIAEDDGDSYASLASVTRRVTA